MKLYFHKEASDINETYGSLSLTPPEPAADTAPGTLTSTTNVNATPPTALCEAADGQTDTQNERVASAASTGNRCLGSFISMPVGNAISVSTADTNAISYQLWSSESATQAAVALNVYLYKWDGTTLTRISTITCAEPSTAVTSCSGSATPAASVTLAASNRIVAIVSANVTTLRSGANARFYFDSSARAASSVSMQYTALGYSTTNKPALSGTYDDDFTTAAGTTSCTTGGVAYHTKWTCLDGAAASTTGAFNAASDSSSWLWLQNQTTATSAVPCNFNANSGGSCATPSNTYIYQTLPCSYTSGNITTVLNSSTTFGAGASTPGTPFNHSGLVLWASDTDYLELQVYATAATTGTSSVNVALNNSGSLSAATVLNSTTTSGIFGEVWLRIVNTSGVYQAQYSTDGTTFNNVGSTVTHSAFIRAGLNSYAAIANPVTSYAGAFEWFSSTLASSTSVSYNQSSYRIFDNADSATPGTALANQNTPVTLSSAGQAFRVRQLISAIGCKLATNNIAPNLVTGLTSSVGGTTSVALGTDGLPRIAFTDSTNSSVDFAQCTNSTCTTANISQVDLNNSGTAGLVIGPDGFGRITYSGNGNTLKLAQCTNVACSTHTLTTVDTGVSGGMDNQSIALGSDGFVRIAYRDATNGRPKLAQCTNASCSTHVLTTIDAGISNGGTNTSIAIGSDGFPRITYDDSANNKVKFAQCTNASCSTNVLTTIDSTTNNRIGVVAVASDTYARIVYHDFTNNLVKFVQCTNAACSTSTITSLITTGLPSNSIYMASDGFARVAAYLNVPSPTLKYITCTNASCSTNSSITIDSSTGTPDVGKSNSLVLDGNDNPYISYSDATNNDLYLASPAQVFKLQYAAQGASCASASYLDVTSSSLISYNDNPTPATDAAISYASGTDPSDPGQSVTAMSYIESSTPFRNPSDFGNTVDGEWDLSLKDNGAVAGTAYCLRLVDNTGTAFTTYTSYPVITMFGGGGGGTPTIDQLMRGGVWFNGGSKQSHYWAN